MNLNHQEIPHDLTPAEHRKYRKDLIIYENIKKDYCENLLSLNNCCRNQGITENTYYRICKRWNFPLITTLEPDLTQDQINALANVQVQKNTAISNTNDYSESDEDAINPLDVLRKMSTVIDELIDEVKTERENNNELKTIINDQKEYIDALENEVKQKTRIINARRQVELNTTTFISPAQKIRKKSKKY